MRYILSPLLACGEGVGGGVLVPHNIGKCCMNGGGLSSSELFFTSHSRYGGHGVNKPQRSGRSEGRKEEERKLRGGVEKRVLNLR
jgi:hypothetical protein